MQNRNLYMCLILLGLHFIGHHLFVEYYSAEPLVAPISLNPAGKISKQIEIRMPQKYDLDLSFSRDGHEFDKLKKLVGGVLPEDRTGIIIPLKWSLTANRSNEVVLQNQVQTSGAHSFSKYEIDRFIDHITVSPGNYILNVEVLQPVPELKSVSTNIKVSYNAKNGTTWHTGYMWWGMLFNYFLSPFIAIIICYKLSQSHKRRLTSQSS